MTVSFKLTNYQNQIAKLVQHRSIKNEAESRKIETNAPEKDTTVTRAEVRGDKEGTVIGGSFSRPT